MRREGRGFGERSRSVDGACELEARGGLRSKAGGCSFWVFRSFKLEICRPGS